MKVTTKSSAILLAVLASSTVVGTTVLAADSDLASTGTVEVKESDDTGGGDGTDPEDPEKEGEVDPTDPEDIDGNKEKGPYKIEHVSKLKFAEIETSAKEIKSNASSIKVTDGGERGAIVGFADVRTSTYGYTVQVKMSEQFTGTEGTLTGSTITYNNGILRSADGNTNKQPKMSAFSNIVIAEDGEARDILEASKEATAAEGKGRFVLEFGQSDEFTDPSDASQLQGTPKKGTAGNSVVLTVPTATASSMKAGNYTAKVTWLMTAQP